METCSNCHHAPEMCNCLDKPGDPPERVIPINAATEYAIALNRVDESQTAEETARRVAWVFLSPRALFNLWIDALIYKYL